MKELYYLTSANINDGQLDEDFVRDIKTLESKGERVTVVNYDNTDGEVDIKPEYGDWPCGRRQWYHDNKQWPVLVKTKPIVVTLDEDLFTL